MLGLREVILHPLLVCHELLKGQLQVISIVLEPLLVDLFVFTRVLELLDQIHDFIIITRRNCLVVLLVRGLSLDVDEVFDLFKVD